MSASQAQDVCSHQTNDCSSDIHKTWPMWWPLHCQGCLRTCSSGLQSEMLRVLVQLCFYFKRFSRLPVSCFSFHSLQSHFPRLWGDACPCKAMQMCIWTDLVLMAVAILFSRVLLSLIGRHLQLLAACRPALLIIHEGKWSSSENGSQNKCFFFILFFVLFCSNSCNSYANISLWSCLCCVAEDVLYTMSNRFFKAWRGSHYHWVGWSPTEA